MASSGGLKAARRSAGAMRSCRAPRAASSAWRRRPSAPASARSSASTWAARRPTSRTLPASTSAAFETQIAGRAPRRADAARAYGGGGRRLDHHLRRHALSRRARRAPAPIPGPKCYRRGGPLTVTDANVMVGKLDARVLPGDLRAQAATSRSTPMPCARPSRSWRARSATARSAGGDRRRRHPHRGREHGQRHQEDLGRARLRRDRVRAQLLRLGRRPARLPDRRHARHRDGADPSAVGAAVGLRHGAGADAGEPRALASRRRSTRRPCTRSRASPTNSAATATEELLDEGVEHDDIAIETHLHLRYAGTDTALPVELSEPGFMRRDFEALHRQRFGFVSPEKAIFVAAIEVEAVGGESRYADCRCRDTSRECNGSCGRRASFGASPYPLPARGGEADDAVLFARELARGARRQARGDTRRASTLAGPALVIEPHQTVVVEPGWKLARDAGRTTSC